MTWEDPMLFKSIAFDLNPVEKLQARTEFKILIEVVRISRAGRSWKIYSWVGHLLVVEPSYLLYP